MELATLQDLYIHELKDLYSAEKQLIQALPKMVKAATHEKLAAGFQKHLEQTREHAARLERILKSHQQSTRGPKCKAMAGLVAEGAEMIEEEGDDEVRDAGLIAAAQRVSITKWPATAARELMPKCSGTSRVPSCSRRPSMRKATRTKS